MTAPFPENWLPMPLIPIGEGMVIVVAATIDAEPGKKLGVLEFQAISDELRAAEPTPSPQAMLDAMGDHPRPRAMMTFVSPESIDLIINELNRVKVEMLA